MKIGIEPGPPPEGSIYHQVSLYVYDIRSGLILSLSCFAGTYKESVRDLEVQVLKDAHESSGIEHKHLAVLINPKEPEGEGELYVVINEQEAHGKSMKGQLARREEVLRHRTRP